MVENLFSLVLQTLTFCGVTYLIYFCIKLKRALNMLLRKLTTMDCDEILAALQADDARLARETPMASVSPESTHVVSATSEKLQRMRARLAALACGGQARVALGIAFIGGDRDDDRRRRCERACFYRRQLLVLLVWQKRRGRKRTKAARFGY